MWRGLRNSGAGDWWGGASLGLLLIKPQLLPPFLLLLLYKRNWRALSGFAIALVGVYLLSALVAGVGWPGPYLDMLAWFSNVLGQPGAAQSMPNLLGLLDRFGINSSTLLLALSLPIVAAFIYVCWRSDLRGGGNSRQRIDRLELQLAAATLVTILTSAHLYTHDLVVVVFSGAALLGWAAQNHWPIWTNLLLLALVINPLVFESNTLLAAAFLEVVVATVLGVFLYILIHPQPELQSAGDAVA